MKNMKYWKISLMGLLMLGFAQLQAQSVTPEVLSTAGETFSNSNISLTWTLGEVMTETYADTIILTQGFQQPNLISTSIETPKSLFGEIKVFPNPTSDILFIERERGQMLDIQLMDMKGSLIKQERLTALKGEISISSLARGIYLLRLSDGKSYAKTIRVEKM